MSDSQVIARKFRPKTFDQVIGQEAITRTLSNALTSGRIHHAYLFTGARGVGKTTTARILAKALNCVKGITIDPCGECASCLEIAGSRSIDVLEIDAASNTGVDNVREVIINSIQIAPARDRYKIFIIDEVHQLSTPAFNALLKTLEEPPPNVAFIMATTELHKVPETILSRCQVFEFRTITIKKLFDQLRHIADNLGVKISDAALLAIARAGEGSMRDAESALDQVISFAGLVVSDDDVSAALGLVDIETLNTTLRAIGEQDALSVLRIVDEVVSRGYDLRNFCREMMTHIRALLVTKIVGFEPELLQLPPGEGEQIVRLAEMFSEQDLLRFFSILTRTEQDIRVSSQPRLQLEVGLIKLVHAGRLHLLEEALNQIQELGSRLGAGGQISAREVRSSGYAPARESAKSSPPLARPATGQTPTPADKISLPPSRPSSSAGKQTSASEARPAESLPTASPRRREPPAQMEGAQPPKPEPPSAPPGFDEPPDMFEVSSREVDESMKGEPASVASGDEVERIKNAIEARGKMMLFSILNQVESMKVDGDILRIVFPAVGILFKNKIQSRENQKFIEEVSREVLGRPLSLSVTISGQASAGESAKKTSKTTANRKHVEDDPKIRALADKFHGSIEVVKPEG